jgi:twitching motility protein PilI
MVIQRDYPWPDEPILVIKVIEQRCNRNAAGLPEYKPEQASWEGLLFRIGPVWYLSALHDVAEIMVYPQHITPIPRSESWLKGVANARGTLMPVIDLANYLGHTVSAPGKKHRLLVVRERDFASALMVDQLLGRRHFPLDTRIDGDELDLQDDSIGPFVTQGFATAEGQLAVLDLRKFLQLSPVKRAN